MKNSKGRTVVYGSLRSAKSISLGSKEENCITIINSVGKHSFYFELFDLCFLIGIYLASIHLQISARVEG